MYKWRECLDVRLEGNVEGFENKRSSGAEHHHGTACVDPSSGPLLAFVARNTAKASLCEASSKLCLSHLPLWSRPN